MCALDIVTSKSSKLRSRVGALATCGMIVFAPGTAGAEEALVTYKSISPDIALQIAQEALTRCRSDGFQVAVVVMDRFGETLVLLRDRYAGLPSPATASSKAYTALSFRMSTGAFAQAIAAKQLSPELARLPNIVPLAGGLTIEAGGGVVGAIGVSGAPGGDKDEACARAGLEAVGDKLEF